MTRTFLGLGSNLGDRRKFLRDAVASLPNVTAVSQIYETTPVGGPPGQGDHLNLVVELETDFSPRRLLGLCQRLQSAAERVQSERWGPRTLDVDILWMEGITVNDPDLQIPHPRMNKRRFVLVPLAELAPELVSETALENAEGEVTPVGTL